MCEMRRIIKSGKAKEVAEKITNAKKIRKH
jgi:hypothetical protein